MPPSRINLRELQTPLKAEYQEHPGAARITLRVKRSASDLADPLHCAISPEANPEVVWRSGAHSGVGGVGEVPCSGDLLLGEDHTVALRIFEKAFVAHRTTVVFDGDAASHRMLVNPTHTLRAGVPVESSFKLETTPVAVA